MADLAAFTDYEREFLRLTQGVPSRISHVLTYESDPGEPPPLRCSSRGFRAVGLCGVQLIDPPASAVGSWCPLPSPFRRTRPRCLAAPMSRS